MVTVVVVMILSGVVMAEVVTVVILMGLVMTVLVVVRGAVGVRKVVVECSSCWRYCVSQGEGGGRTRASPSRVWFLPLLV